tara:strand:- start:105 stop:902 length:798 start_codon:yes stop_codon:yes gene_type:complete
MKLFTIAYVFFILSLTNLYADALSDMIDSIDDMNESNTEFANKLMETTVVTEIEGDVNAGDMYQASQEDIPKVDIETTVYMGDRMIEQRSGIITECLVPLKGIKKNHFGGAITLVKENELACKESREDKNYLPTYINGFTGGGDPVIYDVKLSGKKDGKYKICTNIAGFNGACLKNLSKSDFRFTNGFKTRENSMQRVIEYGGKKGSIVKFIYSEYKNNLIREAFTREFEIDLNDGNVGAYKGAIIEIIKADNVSITYAVKRHFQ